MASRVGKNPINLPAGVEAKLNGQDVMIKGKLGQLTYVVNANVRLLQSGNVLQVEPLNASIESNAQAGTTRALVNNMVHGVSQGFERKLVLMGVGYRAKSQGKMLNLVVGLSHAVDMKMPEGVSVETPSATEVTVKGMDQQLVNQIAAKIRAVRPPEPYKGKGIRYLGEHIVMKEAKKK